MPKFPDRWTRYEAVGDVIPGTRFIAFKVPLSESYFDTGGDVAKLKFTPSDFVQQLGHKVGLVIDLTATCGPKYYHPHELQEHGINYKKILTKGHMIPSMTVIESFSETVKSFENYAEKDMLIGVHCTHGVNRTGYVICRYMIERLNFTADEAMKAFQKGRGYPIERDLYINNLHQIEKIPDSGAEMSQQPYQDEFYNFNQGYTNYKKESYNHSTHAYHDRDHHYRNYNYPNYHYQWEEYDNPPNPNVRSGYTRPDQFQNSFNRSTPYRKYPRARNDNQSTSRTERGRNNIEGTRRDDESRYRWTKQTTKHIRFCET